ncbi:hypothetical protein Psal006b_01083 [Piscirickettsia salmonis]|uniref:FMN reductase n=2 Tax=Piscirickettsia salmonis TaxID=1238 RepID=A0A1L6TD87_PISSA|nr:hypothetical protein [Piscirickettsia salmonis]AKP74356.2 hypothetical protein PSLF89_2777 [Piscirickettsia salmonis LF-89 = ATCC VR-1361]ALB23300.1 FMN reductase [Piscirickettsia salmonis]ALY03205.1 hypothetical protein AWE47_10415 [Piscirickettsia salmonis]AMA42768.1 hypothetical protein AWJ11_10630 [Piscirickettsia salmonis]AOS35240.1 hypothetical protein AVM72_07770 [Piscirickettsia salmonis]
MMKLYLNLIAFFILFMGLASTTFANLTNVYRVTLLNKSVRTIHFHANEKKCTRYITPVDLLIEENSALVVHWITSAINCLGRFAVIKFRVEREGLDDAYLTLDAKLYGKGEVGVLSGGVPIRCKMTSYVQGEKMYDFQCTLT